MSALAGILGWLRRDPPPRVFTGNCYVQQTTGDGAHIGACYHSTYNGVCHVHGDVTRWLDGPYGDWPVDIELWVAE